MPQLRLLLLLSFMLNVIIKPFMLSIVMLCVTILCVIMLNVEMISIINLMYQ